MFSAQNNMKQSFLYSAILLLAIVSSAKTIQVTDDISQIGNTAYNDINAEGNRELMSEVCVNKKKHETYAQRYALLSLYFSMGLDDYTSRNTRGRGLEVGFDNECYWDGVHCVNGLVTRLDLSKQDLLGTIPTVIGLLANLEVLNLSQNLLLTGKIPDLSDLTKLIHLDITDTLLNGDVSELCEDGNVRLISYSEFVEDGVSCKCGKSICYAKTYDLGFLSYPEF